MTVSGRRYELESHGVQAALEGVLPEPIHEHFVVINGRRWPPKQVLALVTGLDRADFTTHQARRALIRLGFPAARTLRSRGHHVQAVQAAGTSGPAAGGTGGTPRTLVEALRLFIGLWVAVRGDERCWSPRPRPGRSWPGWPGTASARSRCSGCGAIAASGGAGEVMIPRSRWW
jgi:hypothetical protein